MYIQPLQAGDSLDEPVLITVTTLLWRRQVSESEECQWNGKITQFGPLAVDGVKSCYDLNPSGCRCERSFLFTASPSTRLCSQSKDPSGLRGNGEPKVLLSASDYFNRLMFGVRSLIDGSLGCRVEGDVVGLRPLKLSQRGRIWGLGCPRRRMPSIIHTCSKCTWNMKTLHFLIRRRFCLPFTLLQTVSHAVWFHTRKEACMSEKLTRVMNPLELHRGVAYTHMTLERTHTQAQEYTCKDSHSGAFAGKCICSTHELSEEKWWTVHASE